MGGWFGTRVGWTREPKVRVIIMFRLGEQTYLL